MKYVFFGTPEFAAIVLGKLLAAAFIPSVVVCNPDRPVGRKKIITAPPAKRLAQSQGIRVWQPEKLEIGNWKLEIGEVDFAVVAAYGRLISPHILTLPRLGVVGVHPSLLPRYRGPSPIQTAILEDVPETGVTLYRMDEKLDHGPIIAISKLTSPARSASQGETDGRISNLTYLKLMRKLAELAGDLLVETIPKFLKGEVMPRSQDESRATYTKKFSAEDGFVEPNDLLEALENRNPQKARVIERKIRALNPEPGVWTYSRGLGSLLSRSRPDARLKLLEASLDGTRLVLKKIQLEGGKPRQV